MPSWSAGEDTDPKVADPPEEENNTEKPESEEPSNPDEEPAKISPEASDDGSVETTTIIKKGSKNSLWTFVANLIGSIL